MGDDILLLLVYVLLSGVFLVMTITINKRMKNGYKIKDAPKYRLFNGTENIRGTIMLMVFFTLFVIGYWGVKHCLRIQPPSIAKIDMALQKDPLLFVLKEEEPETYQKFLIFMKKIADNDIKSLSNEQLQQQFSQWMLQEMNSVFRKRLLHASNATLHQYVTALLKELEYLEIFGSDQCFLVIFPDSKDVQPNAELFRKATVFSDMEKAKIALLREKNMQMQSAVSKDETNVVLTQVYKNLLQHYGEKVSLLTTPENAKSVEERTFLCDAYIEIYKALNDPTDPVKMASMRQMLLND